MAGADRDVAAGDGVALDVKAPQQLLQDVAGAALVSVAETASGIDRMSNADESTIAPCAIINDAVNDEVEAGATAEFEVELTDAQTWAMNFYECAAEGDLECLEEILDSGNVGVDDVDVDGFTALMIAAAEGHHAVVRALLERGADTGVRTHELRSTALHFAAKHGDAEIVEAICANSNTVDYWNANEDTPLIWACIEGRVDAVRVLLAHGADVTAVNHYGAPALLCAVMIGENPDEDDSDHQRAEILRLLLGKDIALVNFQDREGSTAMHLAASCGYLECVKTLLEFGADITLRNTIGQTPLEEAELSDIRGSSECADHLHIIWQQLEEEASARMIAMLEMEESAVMGTETSRGSSKKARKKHKHKSGKRKATTAGKTQVVAADAAVRSADTASSEENVPGNEARSVQTEGANDPDGDNEATATRARRINGVKSDEDGDSDAGINGGGYDASRFLAGNGRIHVSDNTLDEKHAGESTQGAWTTVARKHRGVSVSGGNSIEMKTTVSTRSSAQSHQKSSPRKGIVINALPSSPKRVESTDATTRAVKATANSTEIADMIPGRYAPAPPSRQDAPRGINATPSVRATAPLSGLTPIPASASQYSPAYTQGLPGASSMWRGRIGSAFLAKPSPQLHSSSLLPVSASPLSTPARVGGLPPTSRFTWKHGHLNHHYPSHYYYYQHHQQASRLSAQDFAREATTRWVSKLELGNAAVADSLALLACGHCGELVDDNLQCAGDLSSAVAATSSDSSVRSVCTQLYCSSCVSRIATRADHFTCVKCRRSVARALMRRNEFAQQQAASLALSINHSTTATDTGVSAHASSRPMSLDDMQRALFAAVPRAEAADLRVIDVIPGARELSSLSNGQLEVLEAVHGAARQAVVEQQISNARVLERMQVLEWLKLHRVSLPTQSLTSSSLGSSMVSDAAAAEAMLSNPSSISSWQG